MKKNLLNLAAMAATGTALLVLLAGQWMLTTGPEAALGDAARAAAKQGNMGEFATYAGLQFLMTAGIPLIVGGICICVLLAYHAFTRMQNSSLMIGHIPVRRITSEQFEYVHWVD